MICLGVWIEIRGENRRVGDISGRDAGDAFALEAQKVGLGQQMAMRRYDRMTAAFPQALLQARDSLGSQLPEVQELAERILGRARKFHGD